jgi:hypothetical protein
VKLLKHWATHCAIQRELLAFDEEATLFKMFEVDVPTAVTRSRGQAGCVPERSIQMGYRAFELVRGQCHELVAVLELALL